MSVRCKNALLFKIGEDNLISMSVKSYKFKGAIQFRMVIVGGRQIDDNYQVVN